MNNPLKRLVALGQSLWLDDIHRSLIERGELARLIREDGISGLTSNPAIFEKAIVQSTEYDSEIARLAHAGRSVPEIYETLAIHDLRAAAKLLYPLYQNSAGGDGYVSLEVSPHLARDSAGTVEEGLRLWHQVGRPNLMIKVPATEEGLPAIRALIAAGVNVNVTLIFSVARYRAVAEAYVSGLEDRIEAGRPIRGIASVASFFLSRIDTMVDARLDALDDPRAPALRGQAAVACARLAYQEYRRRMQSARWMELTDLGAASQRLLWASTSTKDPAYSDVKYVDAIVAPETVNTLPAETIDAYRDHGDPAVRIEEDLATAQALPLQLAVLGIDLDAVGAALEQEGIIKFVQPFDRLYAAIGKRAAHQAPSAMGA